MNLIPLILDCEVPYGRGSPRPVSLLTLPLGTGTVLDHLADRLDKVATGEVLVLSPHGPCEAVPAGRRSGVLPIRPVTPETVGAELERYEASDYLLVIDPRLWPTGGHDFAEWQRWIETYRGATHIIAVGANGEGARERVEFDGNGFVRRVQRLYSTKNWSEVSGTSITCSVVPLRAAIGFRRLSPLELRTGLAATGILSQDLPRNCDVYRLGSEQGFLALMERMVSELCRHPAVEGFQKREPEVLVGKDCRIGSRVRLVPPVIIQPGCVLEDEVTIIGPTVIGAGSRIMRGASVIQSALAGNTTLGAEMTIRQQVACGEPVEEVSTEPASSRQGLPGLPLGIRASGHVDTASWGAAPPERGRMLHFAFKRVMDVVLASAALLALSPLLLLVALLVKLDSRGPIFFAHRREGRGGREFPCWKFRTMVADAHQQQRVLYKNNEVDGPQFKMRHDPRVTRVGRWLRGTNIDELPQLFNVVLGHMSLVGPRPSPFRENQICVPWRRSRLSVRPGITGLWQICRDEDREKGDFHEWIFYDMTYVRHFSIWLDIKILLGTVLSLGGRWSVPLGWILPKVARRGDFQQYSMSAA